MTTAFRKSVRDYYKLERAEGQRASQALISAKHDARYGMTEDFYCRVTTPIQRRKHKLMPDYAGDEVRYELPGGLHAIVKIEYDTDSSPPWKNSDGSTTESVNVDPQQTNRTRADVTRRGARRDRGRSPSTRRPSRA